MSWRAFQRFGVVAAAALVAAALRFWPLDGRSYWRDEAFTVDLVRLPFAEMLDEIPRSEGTPPGYYVVAWAWARLFGSSEAGLRSLSALCGVLTVVAIYVTADRLFSRRVAGIAAFVAATSPLLVWYGQEARSYGLGLLAVAVSLAALSRIATNRRSRTAIWVWAGSSSVALATHYFTVFAILPEALWLLMVQGRHRRVVSAVGLVALVGLALIPLALEQRDNPGWITRQPLLRRILEVPAVFLTGPQPSVVFVAVPLALLSLVALVFAIRADGALRCRAVKLIGGLGLATIAAPLILAFVGIDFFTVRNVIFAWPALALVLAASLGSQRAGRLGMVAAVVVVLSSGAISVTTARQPKYGSEDWRTAAKETARTPGPRAIVLSPARGAKAFRYYVVTAELLSTPSVRVREIDVLAMAGSEHKIGRSSRPPRPAAPPRVRGFRLAQRTATSTYTLFRLRAERPTVVTQSTLRALALAETLQLLYEA